MNRQYKEILSGKVEKNFSDLELRIMQDIVRRIQKTGKITSTADYQINRLRLLGNSSEDIERMIKDALDASYPEMFELYDQVIDWEYVRNKDIYEQINADFVPYEQNEQLQQITDGLRRQTQADLQNITKSMGFALDYGSGKLVFTPLAEIYQGYLDAAMMDIASGAFSYNAVLRKVVTQMTNSGLRTVEYAGGTSSRVNVAARRAVMTGITQLTGHVSEMNAQKLNTDHFEVAWHEHARPTHRPWQGKVWSSQQLRTVCGLGSVTGLCGANCYHEYYPFVPGISERQWSDDWLDAKNQEEDTPKTFKGKEYTAYEATQRQRQMETSMRAQREKVQLLKDGGADPDDIMLAKCKYQGQLQEYAAFSKKMELPQQRERIYLDMRGRVAPRSSSKTFTRNTDGAIIKEKEMYRTKSKDSIEPMPKKQLQKIVKGFKKKGGVIQMNDSTDGYLKMKKAEAITYNSNTILLVQKPGRAAVFEELIHATQYREGKNNGSEKERLLCEIEAQEKLLKHQKAYKLTSEEVKQTRRALDRYKKELERLG